MADDLAGLSRLYAGIDIKDSLGVLGDIHGGLNVLGGITINSKVATQPQLSSQAKPSLRPVAHYIARPTLQQQLEERLHNTLDVRDPASKIVVVCGLGGAGKSQLALHYIQLHRRDYTAVLWLEAGSKTTLERDFIQIWRLLFPGRDEKVSIDDAVRGIKAWLSSQQDDKRWLLVFDSADNIDDESHKDYVDLIAYIPDASCVDVIVTTRSQTAKDMTGLDEVQVGNLVEEEATELLLRCSKIEDATIEQMRHVTLIVRELGHFALAVALAGAYIAATPRVRSRLETYLSEYRTRRRILLGRKAQWQIHQYGESVLTTWETTYAALSRQCPEALGCLRLLAFLSADDIFYELFKPLLDGCSKTESIWSGLNRTTGEEDIITQDTLDATLEMLSRYSLLSWREEQNSYAMHKLVHTWALERTTVEEQADHGQQALQFMSRLLSGQAYDPLMRARLVPHLMACFSKLQDWYALTKHMSEKSLLSLATGSDFLKDNGQYGKGVQLCLFRREVGTRLYHDNAHKTVLAADHALAQMYWHLGRWEEAERLDTSTLAKRRRVLGEEHPDTLTSMANLASTYRDQGRWSEAEELEVKVMETRRRVLGEEHPDTLTSMGNLASTYYDLQQLPEALGLARECLRLRTAVLGSTHPDTLTSVEWVKHIGKAMRETASRDNADWATASRDNADWATASSDNAD